MATTDAALLLTLKSLDFFRELPSGQLAALATGAVARTYAAKTRVASERDAVRGFFLVLTGRVKLFKLGDDGKEQTLYVFGPGEPFCLGALFGEGLFPAHAETLVRSRLVFFSGQVLEDMARRDPSILFHFLRVVSGRLKEAMEMIESLSLKGLPGRIAGFLLHAREEERDGRRLVALGISQRELAERLRCGTHTVMGWENGINYPGFWALGVLADEMHCTVDYLMGRENHSAAACKESTMESMASEASEQRSTAD